jgi:hypothetical protein
MLSCGLGGISANSTYSWWACYIGHYFHPLRKYVIPSNWGSSNIVDTSGFIFSGAIIVNNDP